MIYLDNVAYDADIEELSRSYNKIEKYRVRTEDGKEHVKYAAVKQIVTILFYNMMPEVLAGIKQKICSMTPYTTLKILDVNNGNLEIEASSGSIEDEIAFVDDSNVYWGNLVVTFTER